MRSILILASATLVLSCAQEDLSGRYVRHDLVVAANPELRVSNQEVDTIVASINAILHEKASSYDWDHTCANVTVARKGDVISDERLLTAGTNAELSRNLRAVAPSANVLITLRLTCSGNSKAVGCSPVGAEPLVVATYNDRFDGQLWVHERGHGVGLRHSAESPADDTSVASNIGMRFMFWRLGFGHTGKTEAECRAFTSSRFSSVVEVEPPSAVAPIPVAGVRRAASPAGEGDLERSAREVGLTINAMRVVGPPWEQMPVDEIQRLSTEDLGSIRRMLLGDVNAYWAQAITTLGIAGSAEDLEVIRRALETPTRMGASRGLTSGAQVRNLLRAKLAVPQALGLLVNRTRASAPVDLLDGSVRLSRSIELVGPASALAMSFESFKGLAIADTEPARAALRSALEKSRAAPPRSRTEAVEVLSSRSADVVALRRIAPLGVPALTEEEYAEISSLQTRARSGIRSIIE